MESIQAIKQRFGIIGMNSILNRSLEKALRVAVTDISVLVTGESGVGKENIPKIIHQYSHSCLLYTSPSPRDLSTSRMPSSA